MIKYGHTRHGKQNYLCQKCGSQFSEFPQNKRITEEVKGKVKKLLLERISLRGICRVEAVSLNWLLAFIASIYNELPENLNIQVKSGSDAILFRLESEIDEMWSFVGKKENKQWIWLALDPNTKQIIGCYIGNRSKESSQKLFNSLPEEYQKNAHFYTDNYVSYKGVIPENRQTISKGYTNHIERFNGTLRQRASRLVRKTLSFSKKLDNHIGAIKYFLCDYNLQVL